MAAPGRFQSVDEILNLPLHTLGRDETASLVRLAEVAEVYDGAEDERLRIRLNDLPGIKLSIQKQPSANTVQVVDGVLARLDELEVKGIIPADVEILPVDDQARYVRRALNNAIVLVEYIGQQRSAGLPIKQAIIEAARLRLRPILMTTLTTAAGMLPLALAWGEGAEMLQPLAVTMVSGLLFSTLVTLLLIPSVYRLIGR